MTQMMPGRRYRYGTQDGDPAAPCAAERDGGVVAR